MGKLPLLPLPEEKHLRPARGLARIRNPVTVWFALAVGGTTLWSLFADVIREWLRAPGLAVMWGGVGVLVGFVTLLVRRVRKFNLANSAAVALLNEGRVAEAEAALDALARRYRGTPNLHAVVLFNLAYASLRGGKPERAASLFGSAEKVGGLKRSQPQLHQLLSFHLATSFALLGELDAAEAWLAEAKRRQKLQHLRVGELPEAIVLCRRGRFADALRLLDEGWRAIEGTLSADIVRSLRVLRAYALARSGAPEDDVEAMLGGARPFPPGEYDYLGAGWPELQAFLGERRLV